MRVSWGVRQPFKSQRGGPNAKSENVLIELLSFRARPHATTRPGQTQWFPSTSSGLKPLSRLACQHGSSFWETRGHRALLVRLLGYRPALVKPLASIYNKYLRSGSADEFVDYIRIPPMLEASMTAIINQTAIPRLPPTDQGFLLRILQAKLQSPSKSDGSCKTDTSAFRRAAYHGHRHIPIRPICLYMQVYQRRG
jgi:hypothetical protein